MGEQFAAVVGHDHDLLGAVAAVAVLPHDGFEDEDGARGEDDLGFDLFQLVFAGFPETDDMRLFVEEVLPAFR